MRTVTREQAIDDIRTILLRLVDEEHSMCEVAAREGIFCRGFRRMTDEELQSRYRWLVERRLPVSREQLEELANRWEVARTIVRGTSLSCDTQALEHDTCKGWDGFGDRELAEYHERLCGEPVEIDPVVSKEPRA